MKYAKPTDKRLLVECAAIMPGTVPSRIWQPDGAHYWTATCATHEETAGSFVADGDMTEAGYLPMVVAGYRGTIRHHQNAIKREWARDYARAWVHRVAGYVQYRQVS